MESLGQPNKSESQTGNRVVLDSCTWQQRYEAVPIYSALTEKGEPVEIESRTVRDSLIKQDIESLTIYCPQERLEEFKSFARLLKLSPQHQLLAAARATGAIFSKEKVNMLNDVVNGRFVSENEKMLFDPNYPVRFSSRPLLFTPFAVSKDVRRNIIKIAKQSGKDRRVDIKDALLRSVKLGEVPQEPKEIGFKNKKTKIASILNRLLTRTPLMPFEKQLMEQAYDDLINRVGGRDFLSRYLLYLPRGDELMRNDYMDPSLLLMEELESRNYDIHLFRVVASSGGPIETADGLDDCIVALVDQKAKEALDKFWGAKSILNHLYRARGVMYSSYISYTRSWEGSGFSEEERKRLIGSARLKEVEDEKRNYVLRQENPDPETLEYWEKVKAEVEELKTEPADQSFLRGVITRLADRTLLKDKN